MPMDEYVVGVDGCRSGWLICRYRPSVRKICFRVHATFVAVLQQEACAAVIAVDIPIGLTEDGRARQCDKEARQALKPPRAASVFPAPARRLLREQDYEAARERSRELRGKAVSRQAFAIFGKIAEVDKIMSPELQEKVYEVHPEVCFWGMAGHAMRNGKKTPAGYEERRKVLSEALRCPIATREQTREWGRVGAQPDDFLDAAAAAVAADKIRRREDKRLPGKPEIDGNGLRMEMVY